MKKMIAVVVCSVALSAFGATAGQLFEAGKQAFLQNDAEKAADLFEEAVKLDPNNSEYHLWLGRAYGTLAQKTNVFRQASLAMKTKSEFERAVELDPKDTDPRFGLIEWYLIAPGIVGGSEAKAIEQANAIRKIDPLEGHRAFARIAIYDKKPEVAKKEYTDARNEMPNSPDARYTYIVGALFPDKRWNDAFAELDTILKLDPNYMPAYFQLGHVAALAGTDYARGEQSLRKYLTYKPDVDDPQLWRAWYWLGVIEEKTNRKAEAKQSYETSLRLRPNQKDVTEALKRVQ